MQGKIIADMDNHRQLHPDRFLKTCLMWIMGIRMLTIGRRLQAHP